MKTRDVASSARAAAAAVLAGARANSREAQQSDRCDCTTTEGTSTAERDADGLRGRDRDGRSRSVAKTNAWDDGWGRSSPWSASRGGWDELTSDLARSRTPLSPYSHTFTRQDARSGPVVLSQLRLIGGHSHCQRVPLSACPTRLA
jgi:hypothetical protein